LQRQIAAAVNQKIILATIGFFAFMAGNSYAQDRLKTMPGYEQYQKMLREISGSVRLAPTQVSWKDGGKAVEFRRDGKAYRYDIAERKTSEIGEATGEPEGRGGRGGRSQAGGVARGRQIASSTSPDGKLKAFHRDRNLWLSNADGSNELAVTTDGNEKNRIKNGIASWVYGEELFQNTAMWWSPDSKKIAYYRFDESSVPDYYLQLSQTKLQSTLDVEPYPKAGAPNPTADLFIYDLDAKKAMPVDVRVRQSLDA
jgi:dipeptidyl-peptidase-4